MNGAGLSSAETYAVPCVGAIIHQVVGGQPCVLIQERQKADGGSENGLLEVAAGKLREYEQVYSALRREVHEETGLRLSHIEGEDEQVTRRVNGYQVMSFRPFCTSQNLSGSYSILLHSFLCRAEGELLSTTAETANLRWMPHAELAGRLDAQPESFYPLHLNALYAYLKETP